MIDLNQESNYPTPPLLRLGFRAFFFAAGIIGITSMLIWILLYQGLISSSYVLPQYWHAHEMVFAYASATIVGFLLTASRNWTGVQTLYGKPLLALLILWVLGRFSPWISAELLWYQMLLDSGFLLLSTVAIAYPIIKAKNWNNVSIIAKLALLFAAHIAYYLGLMGLLDNGIYIGIYAGFYLVISLLFMMSRRLLPFFIERGLGLEAQLKNSKFLDLSSLVLFLLFLLVEVFFPSSNPLFALLPLALFLIHTKRLINWFNVGIWRKSLLWSIYLAYGLFVLGFLLNALSYFLVLPPHLDLHSFAFGIALMTLSMMCRVSLGHTGRNVFDPPKALNLMFVLLVLSFVFRVVFPSVLVAYYESWILISQLLWIGAFSYFSIVYTPMFFKPRTDGQFG